MRDWKWQDPSPGPEAWRQQLQELQVEILGLLEPLDDTQVNWRPEAWMWSVGQCVDHLVRLNTLVLGPVHASIVEARSRGRLGQEPFRYGLISRWFLRSMSPQSTRPAKTPRKYVPAAQHEVKALAAEFTRMQQRLLDTLDAAQGLDLAKVRARSPALRLLRLPVGIWFAALAAHEARHLRQAQAVRQHAAFPQRP